MIGLFLDLSTRVGWAAFKDAADPAPKFGTERLPKAYDPDDIAARTLPLRKWLRLMIDSIGPDVLGFESPLILMAGKDELAMMTTAQTLRLQVSLAAEVETTAKECGVQHILEIATSSAKVALAGTARLGKEKKRAMLVAAVNRGWNVADDHQADAGAVALVAYRSLGFDVVYAGEG